MIMIKLTVDDNQHDNDNGGCILMICDQLDNHENLPESNLVNHLSEHNQKANENLLVN